MEQLYAEWQVISSAVLQTAKNQQTLKLFLFGSSSACKPMVQLLNFPGRKKFKKRDGERSKSRMKDYFK